MFAYCNNNSVNLADKSGCRPNSKFSCTTMTEGSGCPDYGPNIEFLMAFFGVTSPGDVPDLPEGAMIFVENFTCITIYGVTFVEGKTIVFDENKYCEYYFTGVGVGAALTLPVDSVITQGYVYGVNDVSDYCGEFWGLSFYCAATATGGAYAFGGVRAEITAGTGTSVSLGVSRTYYATPQSGWIYGKASMTIVTNPSQYNYWSFLPGNGSVTV